MINDEHSDRRRGAIDIVVVARSSTNLRRIDGVCLNDEEKVRVKDGANFCACLYTILKSESGEGVFIF